MAQSEFIEKYCIVYNKNYDITFGGLERLHVFDSQKWGKILTHIFDTFKNKQNHCNGDDISINNIYEAKEALYEDLLVGHSQDYLSSLKYSFNVAKIVEVPPVALIPNYFVNKYLLKKFRFHVGGTVLATELAMRYNQSFINIGGGFHHASQNKGMGFCVYADISIAIKKLLAKDPTYKFMIIDLDAHQGNGHETDFKRNPGVFIFDMYNNGIYPHDLPARGGIDLNAPLKWYTKDHEYLELLNKNLDLCFELFDPDLVIYNAGTDCLAGDPLGLLSISASGIIKRDEMVFRKAHEHNHPVVMVTSGGYQMSNASIIAKSICNLLELGMIRKLFEDSINQSNAEPLDGNTIRIDGTTPSHEEASKSKILSLENHGETLVCSEAKNVGGDVQNEERSGEGIQG